MEENRVKDLTFLTGLDNLEVLFLSGNRIEQLVEVQKLESLSNLRELSVVNNSVSRKLLHRPLIVFRQPNIEILDGIPVTPEERMKADLYFSDQPMQQQTIMGSMDNMLPGIGTMRGGMHNDMPSPRLTQQHSQLFQQQSTASNGRNRQYPGVFKKQHRP
ncbi:PREDICTED: leucine-rich repeat-containing protein 9-like isoform X2 [Priapulus caudatus]|uniref:Leucine-rich repeat-containing protein 9-like isoform X2 n=1 Tax=Priapulus caudatus TaxID=37621 RepID=A0ABM1F476_PRICU|nr:PREDICTED: leucine-rich repeat-containing protein 9-like isoform X2 [Priapulus caudatus]